MLIFSDGMAKTNTTQEIYDFGVYTYSLGIGPFGMNCITIVGSDLFKKSFFPNTYSTLYINYWFRFTQTPPLSKCRLISSMDTTAGAVQLSLSVDDAGFYLVVGNTVVASPGFLGVVIGNWYHGEIKMVLGSSGSFQFKLNGVTAINYTGNTISTANSWTDQIAFGCIDGFGLNTTSLSSIFMYDNIGGAPNDFVGIRRIYTLMPVADSATSGLNQFTTNPTQTTGNHFKNVNEVPPDDDASYNSSSTVGQRESYRVQPLPSTVTNIVTVSPFNRARLDDAGTHTQKITARNSSTDALGTAQGLTASYTYFQDSFPADPSTGVAWTPSGFGNSGGSSNAEIGFELES